MAASRIAVIDLETTGLSPWRHDRVVEIGVVVVTSEGEILREYQTLVNPCRDMGPTAIHGITATDVMHAPTFPQIAGDLLHVLSEADIVAGHKISFDRAFLTKEYDRVGVQLPDVPMLCTYNFFGRGSLRACCEELGIEFEGEAHQALVDARATSHLVLALCSSDPSVLDSHRIPAKVWPKISKLGTPSFCREKSRNIQSAPPQFLQRLASKIHHDTEADPPNVLAYMSLIDRFLEDRVIDASEENVLVDAATHWKLSQAQLQSAHTHYLHNLAIVALADGIVTESERKDLFQVAKLLGQDAGSLESVIELASSQLALVHSRRPAGISKSTAEESNELAGKRVCFTGELMSTIGGQPISRDMAEALATEAGLIVASGVTKKLDLLVVADPNTQSGKAKKAREYGTRILADSVFWRMAGIQVD